MATTQPHERTIPVAARAKGRTRLERAFAAHHAEILAYARRRTTDPSIADDVASEVFAVATRRSEELPRRRARPWLIGIARKVLANHYRAEQRRSALVGRISDQPAPADTTHDEGGALGPALAELEEDSRELLLLRYWEGLTGPELASVFGCSRAAIYVRLHRARSRLADLLETNPSSPA